jgi:CHAT domain-containing protein
MPLVIVADGELAAVPFQALRDRERGRYLLQDHEIRFASSLANADAQVSTGGGAGARPLFVADPAFRAADHPGLPRLHGLAGETRAAASRYAGAVVLDSASATPAAVRARLDGAGFFYFAGHAVFDDARPERSYLLLAPDGTGDGRLTAAAVAAMDLRGLRLVVLSACETQRSVTGRAGGFAGLSGAMLAAGAEGVVGSLWRVDDAYTRALMREFHRAYLSSLNPAAALRQAQMRLLGSSDPSLRSPAAWAGFRYAGAQQS